MPLEWIVTYVAFLDADNWYAPDHIETLLNISDRGKAVAASSTRMLCRADDSVMAECPTTNPAYFIDISCMLLARQAFSLIRHLLFMPFYGHLIGDCIFWCNI